jgi:hypothetical protein
MEAARETLQKRNEELEDVIKNRNSSQQTSFSDNRHTTQKDVQVDYIRKLMLATHFFLYIISSLSLFLEKFTDWKNKWSK